MTHSRSVVFDERYGHNGVRGVRQRQHQRDH